MKTFFGGIFLDKQRLKDNGIEHPIKLEYYKTKNKISEDIHQYGIDIIKTEYTGGEVHIEEKKINNITKNENEVENILNKLKKYEVTPMTCEEILEDIFKKSINEIIHS